MSRSCGSVSIPLFTNVRAAAGLAPDHPVWRVISESDDCQLLVYGLEPGQATAPRASSSTVLIQVVEGRGVIRIADEWRVALPGDLAICPPQVIHTLSAEPDAHLIALVALAPHP